MNRAPWQLAGRLVAASAAALASAVAGAAVTTAGNTIPVINEPGNFTTPGGVEVGPTSVGSLSVTTPSTLQSDFGRLGEQASGDGAGSIGAGGAWNMAGGLHIGWSGRGVLDVDAGGAVSAGYVEVGREVGGVGELTVNGTLTTPSSLSVGKDGQGTLAIASGGVINSASGLIGELAPGVGTATLDSGATWNVSGFLAVGNRGKGSLAVTAAALNSNFAAIGDLATGSMPAVLSQGAATIGAGGVWTNTNGLYVGGNGRGELSIVGGGAVATGWVEVGRTHVGVLEIGAGSSLTATGNASLGIEPLGDGSATVDGAGAVMNIATFFEVGRVSGGELVVAGGGKVHSQTGSVGLQAASVGSAEIRTGGLWEIDQTLAVGILGVGSLTIADGGRVTNGTFARLAQADGSEGTAVVAGAGSKWTITTSLEIGSGGEGSMRVEQGGEVSTGGSVFLGSAATGQGDLVVTGVGSKLTSLAQLVVGLEADSQLTVSGGAVLDSRKGASATNSSALVGRTAGVTGTATIAGAGTQWVHDGGLNVGFRGVGVMNVTSDATVHSVDGVLARFATATGTAAVGGGGAWIVDNNLHVGGSADGLGGTAVLNVAAGGNVRVGAALRVWNAGAVNLSGGTLAAASIQHTDGGAFNMTGGVLQVGTFTGNLTNAGGTLAPGTATSPTGTTMISGDYTQQPGATLAIDIGGTASGQYDSVGAGGFADVQGTLKATLVGGFTPALGNSFGILFGGAGYNAAFTSFDLPPLPFGLGWRLNPGGATVFLSVVSVLAGDFDENGVVNGGDLARWRAGFGVGATHQQGDADGDADVDGHDFLIWQRQLGMTAAATAATTVPEPDTALLAAAAIGLAARRGAAKRRAARRLGGAWAAGGRQ